jgi:hypothetical protein
VSTGSSQRFPLQLALLLLLALLPTGCYSHPLRTDPAAALGTEARDVRVTRVDGTTILLTRAVARGDSLLGVSASDDSLPLAIPLTEVRAVQYAEFRPALTLLAIATVGALLAAAIVVLAVTTGQQLN